MGDLRLDLATDQGDVILGLLTIATIAITRFKYAAFLPE